MNKFRLISPVLAVLAMLLAASPSRAGLEIALQEAGVNGGAITVVATGSDFQAGGIIFSGTYGDFTVTINGASAQNGATLSDLLSSTTQVTNSNLVNTGTNTLHLYVTETDYTLPVGALLNVQSGTGGTIVLDSTLGLTDIYQAWADATNQALGTTGFTNGPQTATQTGLNYDTGTASGVFSNPNGVYSLTSEVNYTLSAGGSANYSTSIDVTAVPAPAGLLLALTGLPILGFGWLRRRKQVKQA